MSEDHLILFELLNGKTIIGRRMYEDETWDEREEYQLDKPMQLVPAHEPRPGQPPAVTLVPWLGAQIKTPRTSIAGILATEITKDLVNLYLSKTTGIQIAPAGAIPSRTA
jgi:hypothetical protein